MNIFFFGLLRVRNVCVAWADFLIRIQHAETFAPTSMRNLIYGIDLFIMLNNQRV